VAMRLKPQVMYIACIGPGGQIEWARIGRVRFSKTGRTLYYAGRELRGAGQPWYTDTATGDRFLVQRARQDGLDRRGPQYNAGSVPGEIDEDVREEYWRAIRREPKRSHERVVRS
jgi:hypothetical protein